MSIKEEVLHSIGATEQDYNPGDYIFRESGSPQYYFQVVTGDVKLNNYNSDGKEFIQNILTREDAFGESMLFTDKVYPMNAIALSKCTIIKVCKNTLLHFLDRNPRLYLEVCKSLSERLHRKFVLMQKISSHNTIERLKEVMQLMKQKQTNQTPFTYEVPITRQQLASLTGLCLETTIRTIKKMERDKMLRIKNRKILY